MSSVCIIMQMGRNGKYSSVYVKVNLGLLRVMCDYVYTYVANFRVK